MPVILKRPAAKNDLLDIWEYIADDSVNQADAFINKINQKLLTIASSPTIGSVRNELAEGLRSFSVGRYVIFYHPMSEGIDVVRILHGSRDIGGIFHPHD